MKIVGSHGTIHSGSDHWYSEMSKEASTNPFSGIFRDPQEWDPLPIPLPVQNP